MWFVVLAVQPKRTHLRAAKRSFFLTITFSLPQNGTMADSFILLSFLHPLAMRTHVPCSLLPSLWRIAAFRNYRYSTIKSREPVAGFDKMFARRKGYLVRNQLVAMQYSL